MAKNATIQVFRAIGVAPGMMKARFGKSGPISAESSESGSSASLGRARHHRFQNIAQEIRPLLVAHQLQVAQAVGILDRHGPELLALQEQELDLAAGHAVGQSVVQAIATE